MLKSTYIILPFKNLNQSNKNVMFIFLSFTNETNENMLDYITYFGASTTSLNFWLNWFLDLVSEANVTRGHEFKSQRFHPSFKVEHSVPGMRRAFTTSTLLAQRLYCKGRVRVFNIS